MYCSNGGRLPDVDGAGGRAPDAEPRVRREGHRLGNCYDCYDIYYCYY